MPKYSQYDIPSAEVMVNFGTGQPSNLNLPIEWFQTVCAKMATETFWSSDNRQILQYGAISGYADIKSKMAEWLTEKYYNNLQNHDLNINYLIISEQLFMTNGNTGALHLLLSKYTKSTNYIIVENPTYFIALNIFKEFGLNIEGIDMDIDGVNLIDLENKIIELNSNNEQSILFYYMIPTHHNPTGITMSHDKRLKLAELCNKYDNLYIIADEVYHFLTFLDGTHIYPMADYHPKMLSLGSFSKILAPALRVGWIYQNTFMNNYNEKYGLITSINGLNNSAILDSSGGINPIGFKFIEYALEKQEHIRPIDKIIQKNIEYLQRNRNIMLDFIDNKLKILTI
jgi:DNA-binding transcriptional MocR family regulator